MYLNKLSCFICMALIAVSFGSPHNRKIGFSDLVKNIMHSNKVHNSQTLKVPPPPDHHQYIAMSRFVVHQVDWVSFATISTIDNIASYPFANVVSMADGPLQTSTGIPYFYLTVLDFTAKDLKADNRCTVTVSLEQTGYCREQNYEPDDPRCTRVMLSGSIIKLKNNTEEYEFARDALFSRHPAMIHYPTDHNFFLGKLDLKQIVMLDWFGGPNYLNVDDYLKFNDTILYKDYKESIIV